MNPTRLFAICAGLLLAAPAGNSIADEPPRRLEILFLGDDRGHNPIERYRVLKQALAPRGYNLTFVEDLAEITRSRLDRYDALIVYANHERDTVPGAIKEWVNDGGGLVALHSAAGCFHPSEDWFDLIGGRFLSHEGHVFSPENVDHEHPITRELPKLEAWDETYVHQNLTEDRHLLQVRPPIHDGETEPEDWTWTREEGKGRVFYTASGHDLRTWGEPAYQELVARAILWSVGPERAALFAGLDLAELELHVPEVENRTHPEIPMMPLQKPLSPEDSAKHTQVPAGTRLELFASEPMVVNPIAIDFDERGRCWVVESLGYPNSVPTEPGTGTDRIKILEDTTGDGRADKVTVFADGLRLCTSIVFVRGGVIATDGPDFVLLRDTTGDDIADSREVLATGINMHDTHACVSQLLYGLDNWIYATVGYSGLRFQLPDGEHSFANSVFRFAPDLSAMEFLQRTTNNTWGLGFSNDGGVFGSTANNNPSWMVSIPAAAWRTNGVEQPLAHRLDNHPFMYPNTRDITQVDQIERFTAAADHKFYTDRFFGDILHPDIALICEPTGHLVAMGLVTDHGALKSINLRGNNLFASSDAWASPVAVRVGPDGAVWIADWYNPVIQHNVVFRFWNPAREYDHPHSPYQIGEHRPGRGNAYETPLRDREHGRIWRIVPAAKPLREVPVLDPTEPDKLVQTLNSPSQHLRLHAQRLLVERGDPDVVPALVALVADSATPEDHDLPLGAYHALRTLSALPGANAREAVIAALEASHSGLRIQAMQSLDPGDVALVSRLPALLANATSPREQLLVLTTCALAPPNEPLAAALWDHATAMESEDPTLRNATSLALRRQGATLLGIALGRDSTTAEWADEQLREVARRVASGPNRASLVSALEAAAPAVRERYQGILEEVAVEEPQEMEIPEHLMAGRRAYLLSCVECHQAQGEGVAKTFPPLAGSEWLEDRDVLLKIMLGGVMGEIQVKGETYNSAMPGHIHASNDDLAAIANYVRHVFGGIENDPVTPDHIEALRPEVKERLFRPYTVEELR